MRYKDYKQIYFKAKEIEYLSDSISRSFMYDYEHLDRNGKEHPDIYFLGDLIRDSNFLSLEVLSMHYYSQKEDQIKFALKARLCSSRLFRKCKRLEKNSKSGKDYIYLLKKELKRFNRLQEKWIQI